MTISMHTPAIPIAMIVAKTMAPRCRMVMRNYNIILGLR